MFSISALFRVLLSLSSSLLQELIHIFFCDDGVRDFVVLRHILAGHQRLTGIYVGKNQGKAIPQFSVAAPNIKGALQEYLLEGPLAEKAISYKRSEMF